MNEPTDPTLTTPPEPASPDYTLQEGRTIWRNGKPFLTLFRSKEHTSADVADAAAQHIVALLNNAASADELSNVMRETLARLEKGDDTDTKRYIRRAYGPALERYEKGVAQ